VAQLYVISTLVRIVDDIFTSFPTIDTLDFLRPIRTAEAFEAVDWLADLPQ